MEKENIYNRYQTQVKNKDTALCAFMQRVLCITSKMFEYTGVDGIMIGRGTFGNPWIFERIKY